MAKKKEEKATVGTVEEGDIYVGLGGLYYSKPQIDATKISDCLKNNYVSEQFVRLRGMVFIDKYKIEVKDAAGNEDVKLEQRLVQMCESKGVRLWSKMQMAYADIFGWGCAFFNPVWQQLDNERVLTKLRRLPPESFKDPDTRLMVRSQYNRVPSARSCKVSHSMPKARLYSSRRARRGDR